jgi:hypothetical protein
VILSYWVQSPTEAEVLAARSRKSGVNGPDTFAVFHFPGSLCHMFGYPNEEADSGHPLSARGYHAFGVFEVKGSSWIAQLERMNRVHPAHRKEHYDDLRHFIFGFHDSTFEILAQDFSFELMTDDWHRNHVIARMRELLEQ